MNKIKLNLNVKGVGMGAFMIGFGYTVGVYAGRIFNTAFDRVSMKYVKNKASNGNEFCQKVCDEYDVDYERREEPSTEKVEMGFHQK